MRTLWATAFLLMQVSPSGAAQDSYGKADAPLVAEVLGTSVHTTDPGEMQYVILQKLTERYAREQRIEVTPSEIDAYVEAMRRAAAEDRKQWQAKRDELDRQLRAKTLTETQQKSLSVERDTLNELLKNDPGSRGPKSTEDQAAERQVAAAFIRQWKINRALYKQYSGRIVYQQGGPEPLDAYRRFLEEQQKEGAFRILNPAFEPPFWEYYVTDSKHSFYPAGSKEEAQAFETPWWLTGTTK